MWTSNLFCSGYVYIRGFLDWHGGVDMAKKGGCWEAAAGPGVVIRAGWGNAGEGYHVVIDHGNGLKTRYYHGNGNVALKKFKNSQNISDEFLNEVNNLI